MDDEYFKRLDEITQSPTMRLIDEIERERALRRQLTEFSGMATLERLARDLRAPSIAKETIERLNARESFLEQISAVGSLSNIAAEITTGRDALTSTDRMALSVTEELGTVCGLFNSSVSDALNKHAPLLEAMGAVRTRDETLASLSLAAREFERINDPASFATVGAASFAASDLFRRADLIGADFSSQIDPFFGDWSRLTSIPPTYPSDTGARREVIKEIEADEGLLDVDPEEAASILEESLIDADSKPILVLGIPTGLVMAKDPGEATYSLLAHAEQRLRRKVATVMSSKFGENWLDDKCAEFVAEWRQKRDDELKANLKPCPLIDYSTIYELKIIITRYWADGFAIDGRKPRSVSQPLDALMPFRNRTFHARPINAEILFGVVNNVRKIEPWLDASDDEQ